MILAHESRELAHPGDLYRNYCLWPYEPQAPIAGSWRPVNLLYRSFQIADAHANFYAVVDRLRANIGASATVWGVKWCGGRLGWEYYFYDYERRERTVSLQRVLRALDPLVRSQLKINERLPYFMFSIDMSEEVLAQGHSLDKAHIYVGHPGSLLSAGICYELSQSGLRMENLYSFFDARSQLEEAAEKIGCSVHADLTEIDLDAILWPELRHCHSICVANKPTHDTVYFSGVTTDQLLLFLTRLQYPRALVDYLTTHRDRFAPLLHDVGFDYVGEGSQIRVLKSGFYGVF